MSTTSPSSETERPVLVIDKKSPLGPHLVERLARSQLTVFVSAQDPSLPQCVHIPFRRKVPVIPDNAYSQIFVVYLGEKELLASLPSLLRKVKTQGGKVIVLTTLFHTSSQEVKRLLQKYPELLLLVMGDVFGEFSFGESQVQLLLDEARLTGKIHLPPPGLLSLYPVHSEDVMEAILVLGMGPAGSGVYALFPKYPPTALSFVRLLERFYPLLQLDFKKIPLLVPNVVLPEESIYIFGRSYPLESRLKKLDLTHTPLASLRHKKKKRRRPVLPTRKSHPVAFLVIALLFLISLPLASSLTLSVASGAVLLRAQHAVEKGEFARAQQASGTALTLLEGATYTAYPLTVAGGILGLGGQAGAYQDSLHTGRLLTEAFHEGVGAVILVQDVLKGTSSNPEGDFYTGLNKGREALQVLQRLQAEERLPGAVEERLREWEPTLRMLANTMETYPELLGFSGKKTYLVLFQNNYELRPTGGFIGSYGLVSVENGRVGELTIHDVYDADGQLKEKIVPPYGLSRHLGASNWFLRDSNYYLDYPTSAATIANFLKLETGEVVDGVLAIDVHLLANLLQATGPLSLPDYNETLTKDNFFLITQTYAEKDFFPGSTQKKDFLQAVRKTLEQKFQTQNISYPQLLRVVTQAVQEKHLLFAFADERIQTIFSVNNMAGSMDDPRHPEQGRVKDFLAINEANVGLTKGNYYLKRKILQRVAIDGEGRVREEVEIAYTNTSTKDSPFGGDYKSYVRVALPKDATITGFHLDGREQEIVPAVTDRARYTKEGFVPPRGVELEETTEYEKKIAGFLVTVPMQATRKITLFYTRQERAAVESTTFGFDLLHVKQPGTDADPYTLQITYPVASVVMETSEPVSDLGGKLLYEKTLKTDSNIRITFARK